MVMIAVMQATGCTAPIPPRTYPPIAATPIPPDARFARFAADVSTDVPGTQLLSAPSGTCGPSDAPVVRIPVPEQVLFATASDRPGPNAAAALADVAGLIAQDVPDAELTVLGHTDAIGSDAYNMDLSRHRAVAVLTALVAQGLDPNRLSAVAIGKRQPIADNATPEGRARNRRVEFLIARCLAANLGVVAGVSRSRALLSPDEEPSRPVEVVHLDASGPLGLAPLRTIVLRPPEGNPPIPVATAPSATVAQPAPAPHYQPRTLAPGVQRNPLGPAVPF
jgi:outer membrane protein OmpA-like peptidoglycan-associated protein